MPKNVMKLLKRSHNSARHAFDLSHRHVFTSNFGELLPSTFIEVVPDDYIELRAADLLRAIPMVTSPFLRAKQHIDVWYCPYDYLWGNFSAFMTQKSQPVSTQQRGQSFVPHEWLDAITGALNLAGTSGKKDVVGRAYLPGAKKLFDLCGYGNFTVESGAEPQHMSVNLWRIAAYNKIWYDEYRQQYYDEGYRFVDGSSESPAAAAWNFDDLKCTTSTDSRVMNGAFGQGTSRLQEMFQMRYRCWKKDLFTGVLPSTQFGAVSSIAALGDSIVTNAPDNSLVNILSSTDSKRLVATSAASSGGTIPSLSQYGISLETSFDILALRKSEAVQIWRERALTAGNRISDNLRSHYGNDAEYDDHRCTFLGSVSAPLNISDIDSHAQIGDGANQGLADVAGKGISTLSDQVFKFKAHEFGVIVCMFSLLPEAEYESAGVDRMNQLLEMEDYFVPEYQDLGLEGVSSTTFYNDAARPNPQIFGYAPRYWGYKQKIDKCFSGFWHGETFAPWSSPKYDVASAIHSNPTVMPLSCLYVNPALYDSNFQVSVDNSDQFLCDLFFDCSATRAMSVSGLPNY